MSIERARKILNRPRVVDLPRTDLAEIIIECSEARLPIRLELAARAMQGICASNTYDDTSYTAAARVALRQADALIAAYNADAEAGK